jgi:outer membrane protein insertion porin family
LFRYLLSGLIVAIVATLALRTPAVAQDAGVIQHIVVDGNQRIEPETIRSYLTLTEGDPFDAIRIDKSLKALFNTGLFADVTIKREDGNLIVRVVENPTINRIAFEGNHHLESDKLQAEIQLKQRGVYNRTKVQGDVQRLLDLYKRNGRFAATVDPKLIKLADNRVDLVFEINEGSPTYVTRIDFIGNKAFSDGDLKDVIESREERWYRFLSNSDSYDPDRVNYDREQLRKFYLKKGYADFRVVSAVAQLTPDRRRFFLTFTVEEGERYKVGKVDLISSLPDIKVDALKPLLLMRTGDWYDADEVEKTIQSLTDAVGNKGYAFVDIRPRIDRDTKNHILGITFDIGEGRRVVVERIDIEGNVRTYDKVIRRQFALVEGDAFNSAKQRRSEQSIKDLDFFKTVKVTNEESDTAADRTVVKVAVEEKSTGSLSLGAGWSSLYGPLASIGAKERNILGTGQEASIDTTLALLETSINFNYTDPYFLDRHIIAGFDLFSTDTRLQELESYQTGVTGGDIRAGYYYNDYLRHDFTYTSSLTNIHDIQPGTSQFIAEQAGVTYLSMMGHLITYDRRDSKVDPTTGYYVKFGNDVAGLGGTPKFVRTYATAGQYFQLADDYELYINGGAGYVAGYAGSDVLINQRFYLGGASLRGFRDAGVTPVDRTTLTPLGAIWNTTASAEVTFPLGLPKEVDIKSLFFVDTGIVGPTDPSVPASRVLSSEMPRVGIGTGFVWVSPLGPVDVSFGYPIVRTSYDEIQIFRFNFGTRF